MDTAVAIRDYCADWGLNGMAGSHVHPATPVFADRSGRLLLTQSIHELDQFDGAIPVLGRGGIEALLLAIREAIERGLVVCWRVEERLRDRGLQIVREIRAIGIGSVDDLRRFVDDAEIFLLHRRAIGIF